MKMRVCEYNENVVGIRIAHIDFYMDAKGIVACPFTKGEVDFANSLVSDDDLRTQLEAANQNIARLREALGQSTSEKGQTK